MSDPVWLSYTGAITGVIGAVYRYCWRDHGLHQLARSEQLKALDLRLELRKAEADLRHAVQELPSLLERAKRSHTAVAAAAGRHGSGAFEHWISGWETDLAAVQSLDSP